MKRLPAITSLREMLNLVRTDNVDAVIVYEFSRVGRTFWETLEAIKSIEEFAPLISCSPKEIFLQTTDISVRKLMIGILTWVAEREREILIQRTRDGMQRARISGKRIGRPMKILERTRICSLNYYHKIFHVIRLQKIWECQRLLYISKFIILLTNLKIFY